MIRAAGVLVLVAASAPAFACSRAGSDLTTEERFTSASAVFIAHVHQVRERSVPFAWSNELFDEPILEAEYSLKETLKGAPPRNGKLYDSVYGIGNCSIGLMVDWDYLVMVQPNEERSKIRYVGMPSGSFPVRANEADDALAAIRRLAQQESKPGTMP